MSEPPQFPSGYPTQRSSALWVWLVAAVLAAFSVLTFLWP